MTPEDLTPDALFEAASVRYARLREPGGVVGISADGDERVVVLGAGQAGSLGAAGAGVAATADPDAASAWRRGRFVFHRTPLGRVVAELNRHHSGRIVILNQDLERRPVTGAFDTARPAAVVDLIEATLAVRSIRITDRLILLH